MLSYIERRHLPTNIKLIINANLQAKFCNQGIKPKNSVCSAPARFAVNNCLNVYIDDLHIIESCTALLSLQCLQSVIV